MSLYYYRQWRVIFVGNNTSVVELGVTYYVIDDNNYGIYFNDAINSKIIHNNEMLVNTLCKLE